MTAPTRAAAPTSALQRHEQAGSLDQPPSAHWRRWRGPLGIAGLLLVTALALGIIESRTSGGFLDPDGVDAAGARALARLLTDQGVEITPVRTTDAAVAATGPGDTMLVTEPDLLRSGQVDEIVDTGAELVLVAPQSTTGEFAPGVHSLPTGEARTVDPGCDLAVAERAGPARAGSLGYAGDIGGGGAKCYRVDGEASLVVATTPGGNRVTLLGSGDALTNEHLDQEGNAALALGMLGGNDRLVWYRPVPEGDDSAAVPLTDHLPDWVRAAAWQVALAIALAAIWRARRLGRLVMEPLPVAVPANETTRGRARLYRRGPARDHAAAILREASARRLAHDLRLPFAAPADAASSAALAEAVADRTGRPLPAVTAMLAGPPPTDDDGLVRLADDLDALEKEVRSP